VIALTEERRYIKIPILLPRTLIESLDEILLDALPAEYKGVAKHYINAKIELLRAVEELINTRIKKLEEKLKKFEEVKKEKVKVE